MVFMAQVNWIVGTSQTPRGGGGGRSSAKYATNRSKIWIITIVSTSIVGTMYDTCIQRGTHIFGIIQQLSESGCMHVMKGLKMMD